MAKIKRKTKKEEQVQISEDRADRFTSNGEGVLFFANEEEYRAYKKEIDKRAKLDKES